MNLSITDSPITDGEIAAFMDTSEGTTKMDLGALDSPDLTVPGLVTDASEKRSQQPIGALG